MDTKPLCVLSLPKSGGTWFVKSIAVDRKYDGTNCEFFNPDLNSMHRDKLVPMFGGESNVEGICLPYSGNVELTEKAFQETWGTTNYRCTKEVWSFTKVPFFAQRFRCICLLRHRKYTFPGSSEEGTNRMYLAIYKSLIANFDRLPVDVRTYITVMRRLADTQLEQLVGVQIIASYMLAKECLRRGIPVLLWKDLVRIVDGATLNALSTVLPLKDAQSTIYKLEITGYSADVLLARSQAYAALGVEAFVQKFLRYTDLGSNLLPCFA